MDFSNNNGNGEQRPFANESMEVKPLTALEERQQLLAHHVRLVARKYNHALFIFGATPGLGKSSTVLEFLDKEGTDPDQFSHHAAGTVHNALQVSWGRDIVLRRRRFNVLVHAALGLLRSALWGSPRAVTYGSSQLPDGLPSAFDTTARFIFAANVMPRRKDAFKGVLSRFDIFELSATNEEVIDLMRSVSGNGFKDLPPRDCRKVIEYIAENADDRQLSMRLLGPSLRKLLYARGEGIDWRPMIKSQLRTLGRKNQTSKRLGYLDLPRRPR